MLVQSLSLFLLILRSGFAISLCAHHTVSCSSLLFENDTQEEACSVQYYPRNSPTCSSQSFSQKPLLGSSDVLLNAYKSEYEQIMFNVTFTKITWKEMKIQYMQVDDELMNSCRDFVIWNNVTVPAEKTLYYDCNWSLGDYETKLIYFSYEVHQNNLIGGRRFTFKVPPSATFESEALELFLYIDISDPHFYRLFIQQPPSIFNVSSFEVRVYRMRGGSQMHHLDTRILLADPTRSHLQFEYQTFGEHGRYVFNVTPVSPICTGSCNASSTPILIIEHNSTHLMVVGIVSAFIILPAALLTMCLWSRRKLADTNRNILVAYCPSSQSHIKVVKQFVLLLRKVLNTDVYLDVLDSPTKDPFQWYIDSFNECSLIIFVSSPTVNPNTVICRDGKDLVMRLFGDVWDSDKRVYHVQLPYVQEQPTSENETETYTLMQDLVRLMKALKMDLYYSRSCVDVIEFYAKEKLSNIVSLPEYASLEKSIKEAESSYSPENIQFDDINLRMMDDEDDDLDERDLLVRSSAISMDPIPQVHELDLSGTGRYASKE